MQIIPPAFTSGFWLAAFLIFSSTVTATQSNSVWKDVEPSSIASRLSERIISGRPDLAPLKFRALELDERRIRDILSDQDSSIAARTESPSTVSSVISIPLPQGGEVSLRAESTSVMAPELEQQFPQLKTWKVTGVNDHIHGRIDFTTQGFHAMLLMPDGDTVFIEPDKESLNTYLSFSKHSNKENFSRDFKCGVHSEPYIAGKPFNSAEQTQARPVAELITYRLAIAATGEYTQNKGGTKAGALSAIVTTINRVNEIYERDLAIRFELIPEEDDIIYIDPNTDPYSNTDVSTLLAENIKNLSNTGDLSIDRYDVGHVFSAANVGGLAYVGEVCDNLKAGGATGIFSPFGDAFDLDYVAHELGHQLGGTHTFNSICVAVNQRIQETAVEPGSGSTIMSYAGICQSNNIQSFVDPQFHAVSIAQITSFSQASSCGGRQAVLNENPVIDAGPDFSVPARTPLMLVANGSDLDGVSLTYTWEQSDAGAASDVDVDTGDNAIFRSRLPSTSGIRYIPSLSDLFDGTSTIGEVLPVTNRNMELVATIRDGEGGVQTDLVNAAVFDMGVAFSVTSHNSFEIFGQGDRTTVSWDVAGTDVTPISCENVDISLVTPDGNGIDVITTANDGQQQVSIPSNAPAMNNARFMVACSSSPFFNISSAALTILNSIGDGGESAESEDAEGGGGGGSIGYLLIPFISILFWRRNRFSLIKHG